ncbi:uncharacterized protein K460DRAFT_361179 [Cucurbitaria berberidis CBS 394.84]|uniref:TORC1 subunit TCO89 domain-containing protein n=1 Tax=Cucurbitaria berberidis CBS 394.84 TaxID=1168544 RepID=A0A9P4GPR9_9PLEO|nr:uncharacterized protein K460DRAFT_361179 [Cucurbitaria berberidis CBS 394.84]KAF1850378.1 hypothetical protein K460DRAFT_361179 [Cucurbitaria berberidis CBS 394.84]
MASADESHSRPKRPAAMTRQSSSQSHLSQSPSEGPQRPVQHKVQRHVVGQRVQRNLSAGKNLNKLAKAGQQVQQAAENTGRHHRRSQSGNSVSAPSSPRPSFKRNASSGAIVRVNQQVQAQANLRKNFSSGHLARQGHAKHALKASKTEAPAAKRSLGNHNKSRPPSPEAHATVHFDAAIDDEGGDDGWTEESASQSPNTTRSNTRSNSVILEAQHKIALENMENNRGEPSSQVTATQEPPTQATQTLTDRTRNNTRANGGSSHQHSRPADADMITSRLLQRSASHNVPPQTSSVAATAVSSSDRHNLMSTSVGSTLVDTPGRDLVSRFMDGDGSAGTPKVGGYMPSRTPSTVEGAELSRSKRNKSMPNVSDADAPPKAAERSGTNTPNNNLPPSRTQQKLMLQRASSNIDPQKLVPVTLPRNGGPNFLHSGMHYNADGEGRLDPRLQQQLNNVAVEYKVVRRYRNPLADALARIQQTPGMSQKSRIPKAASLNGFANVHGTSSLSTSFHETGLETDGAGSRRSRVSLERDPSRSRTNRDEGDFEGLQSFESDEAQSRNEADEICRRLWESAEVVEAD